MIRGQTAFEYYDQNRDMICARMNSGEAIESIANDLRLELGSLYQQCKLWKRLGFIEKITNVQNTRGKGKVKKKVGGVKPMYKETNHNVLGINLNGYDSTAFGRRSSNPAVEGMLNSSSPTIGDMLPDDVRAKLAAFSVNEEEPEEKRVEEAKHELEDKVKEIKGEPRIERPTFIDTRKGKIIDQMKPEDREKMLDMWANDDTVTAAEIGRMFHILPNTIYSYIKTTGLNISRPKRKKSTPAAIPLVNGTSSPGSSYKIQDTDPGFMKTYLLFGRKMAASCFNITEAEAAVRYCDILDNSDVVIQLIPK